MKSTLLCGIGNAILDILIEVSEDEFGLLELERGSMTLLDAHDQAALLRGLEGRPRTLVSGGSVANSIALCAQLGGSASFIGCVGDDIYGRKYSEEMSSLGVTQALSVSEGEPTGTCVSLITPDAERTMRTCLAASGCLMLEEAVAPIIAQAEWIFVEGYLLANPLYGHGAVRTALEIAKDHGTKVAITLSDPGIVRAFSDQFAAACSAAALVIGNIDEIQALTGVDDPEKAFTEVAKDGTSVIMTMSEKGARGLFEGKEAVVSALPCTPTDLTGAGDAFAGALFYGLGEGMALEKAMQGAAHMAHAVITQLGARLNDNVKQNYQNSGLVEQ